MVASFYKRLIIRSDTSNIFVCFVIKTAKNRIYVMIYGFYGVKLGDDLFFEKLITRYPDTMFFV